MSFYLPFRGPSRHRKRWPLGWSLALALAACGSPYVTGRPTTINVARSDDPWLVGDRCPTGASSAPPPFEVISPGVGTPVGPGDTVRVHYVATLREGGAVVHDTHDESMPSEIVLGSTKTLCGFEQALIGMQPGEERRVTVPAALAFGDDGHPPEVPPHADLVFVIDLYLPASISTEHGARPTNPSGGGRGGGRR